MSNTLNTKGNGRPYDCMLELGGPSVGDYLHSYAVLVVFIVVSTGYVKSTVYVFVVLVRELNIS